MATQGGFVMQNFVDPAILFFIFGVFAGGVRSNLEIPRSIAKFLSLYLLMSLGLKGGFALAKSGFTPTVLMSLGAAMAMAFIVPTLGYNLLKRWVSRYDAAAVSAAYGSISAVTFVTAMQFLEAAGFNVGGHMSVAMVAMESPAVIMVVLLANSIRQSDGRTPHSGISASPVQQVKTILHESFTDGAQLLLLGSMVVGYLSGETGKAMMHPFSGELFKGMLSFFLLDMGLLVAKNFQDARKASPVLLAYALIGPLVHASIALFIAKTIGMPIADAVILMVLSASASYIVVPAVLRYAIPEANPAIYLGLSLGATFPLNILFGIPTYTAIAKMVLV